MAHNSFAHKAILVVIITFQVLSCESRQETVLAPSPKVAAPTITRTAQSYTFSIQAQTATTLDFRDSVSFASDSLVASLVVSNYGGGVVITTVASDSMKAAFSDSTSANYSVARSLAGTFQVSQFHAILENFIGNVVYTIAPLEKSNYLPLGIGTRWIYTVQYIFRSPPPSVFQDTTTILGQGTLSDGRQVLIWNDHYSTGANYTYYLYFSGDTAQFYYDHTNPSLDEQFILPLTVGATWIANGPGIYDTTRVLAEGPVLLPDGTVHHGYQTYRHRIEIPTTFRHTIIWFVPGIGITHREDAFFAEGTDDYIFDLTSYEIH